MLALVAMLSLAQVSSPIGDGVCVTFTAALDSSARELVGQSVEGIGGYCSLTGCRMSGRVTGAASVNGAFYVPDPVNTSNYAIFIDRVTSATKAAICLSGTLSTGACLNSISVDGTTVATFSGPISASALTATTTVNGATSTMTGFYRSVGVATGSLPTCNAGAAGSLEYDTTLKRAAICDDSPGSFAWRYACSSTTATLDVVVSTGAPSFMQPTSGGAAIGIKPINVQSGQGVWWSSTAPTIGSGFCTSPTITRANGTISFLFDVGSACAASSGVITMPAASNAWTCECTNTTAPQTRTVTSAMTSSTSVTLTSRDWAGTATNFVAGDDIACICSGQ
jgi:hypothetical protein